MKYWRRSSIIIPFARVVSETSSGETKNSKSVFLRIIRLNLCVGIIVYTRTAVYIMLRKLHGSCNVCNYRYDVYRYEEHSLVSIAKNYFGKKRRPAPYTITFFFFLFSSRLSVYNTPPFIVSA